jgi:hypothetical protein
MFVLTILSGLISRLGTILIFMATVKCALWLLKPEAIPHRVVHIVDRFIGHSEFVGMLLLVPPVLAVCVAIASVVYAKARMRVVIACGDGIAITEGRKRVAAQAENFAGRQRPPEVARALMSEALVDWNALYRLQVNLLKLVVLAVTFAMAVLFGAMIDPFVTGIVIGLSLLIAGAIVWRQHESSYVLSEDAARRRIKGAERNAEFIKKLDRAIDAPGEATSLSEDISRHHRAFMADFAARDRSDTVSRLGLDFAQGLMLFVMLVALYFRGLAMSASEVAYAVILLVLLRFSMSVVRAIASHAMALSRDYRRLVIIAGYAGGSFKKSAFANVVDEDDDV